MAYTKKALLYTLLFFISISLGFSQIEVQSPSGQDNLRSCPDYADEVHRDRWDMNERTDLGWRIFNTVEEPYSYITDISFQNGLFSCKSVYSYCPFDPDNEDFSFANITILDSGYLNSNMVGKNGANFPINADKYTTIAVRMYLSPGSAGKHGRLVWSKNTIYNGVTTSNSYNVYDGWFIYLINIPNLGAASGYDNAGNWEGYIDSLRLDPVISKDKDIKIDWIRLVDEETASVRTISWSGNQGPVDIYLDNDNDPSNGTLGMLAQNIDSRSYDFLAGALFPGNYYAAVAPSGTGDFSYSPGFFHVNDAPIIKLTRPSAKGSDDDFITTNFQDPWDMNNPEDIEHTEKINNGKSITLNYEDLAGNPHSNQNVFYGESQATDQNAGDPHAFLLHFLWRGGDYPINTSRYHNLTFKLGIWGAHSTVDGSVARVIWRRSDEEVENVSQAFVIRHLPQKWIMHEIVIDMNELPIEDYPKSPSQSGWTGLADCFRLDPHEFPSPRAFFIDEVRLTADYRANDSFSLEWDLSDSDSSPEVTLYYDDNDSGYDGTQIIHIPGAQPPGGSYLWDTSSVPEGTYWIYAEADDGINQNRNYGGGPVIISHSPSSELNLSKNTVYLGAERNGPGVSTAEVLITNIGEGTLNWEAVPDQNWIKVSPSSGTGENSIEIGLQHTNLSPGSYSGLVKIQDTDAVNSPQFINVELTVYQNGGTSSPYGAFDTPVDGSTVSGSIPVTGWALDDVKVERVRIKRMPVSGEPSGNIGPDGLVFIGDAVFVKGARPDIASRYPQCPGNEEAGWGYMMLTNFLPNQGNGTFTLYALAVDSSGQQVTLGQKTIECDNANRVKPFGTIDTPAQGETISGTAFSQFGWALTPLPKKIPEDGSTINVYVDGVNLGNPDYGHYRQDIADLFPDCLNSDGAVGVFTLDTTQFTNGVHNIAWSVEDDEGQVDGIGSRYFEIQNINSQNASLSSLGKKKYQIDHSGFLNINLQKSLWLKARIEDNPLLPASNSPGNKIMVIETEQLERIHLKLNSRNGKKFIGWAGEKSAPLPAGSHLNPETGEFFWLPGPGFLGRHILHFSTVNGEKQSLPLKIIVDIVPKKY